MDLETSQHKFVLDLLQQLYHPEHNLVLSPYSLISALVMLLIGSSGTTQLQIVKSIFDSKFKADTAEALKYVQTFAQTNKELLDRNQNTLEIANLLYSSVK